MNKQIKLLEPKREGGISINEAFAKRRSSRGGIDSRKISTRELSDLLWAANGVNRNNGGRTAPSTVGKKDIDIYVISEEAAYLYNPDENILEWVTDGDLRPVVSGGQDFVNVVPLVLVLVSDTSRFDDSTSRRPNAPDLSVFVPEWGALDAGIVSQNINLYCAGHNLASITRATMYEQELRKKLKLKDSQIIFLNNAVGYPIE